MHNHTHFDWNGDGRVETITASEEGVFLIRKQDSAFNKLQLGTGAPSDKAELRGAGEIKVGKKLKGGTLLPEVIEPMHGTSVAMILSIRMGRCLGNGW